MEMRKLKKIILWGGWYGSQNVGDRALLLAITDMLQQALDPVHFIALSAKPKKVYEYTIRDSDASIESIRTKQDMGKVITELAKADLFIFGGAVPFFDDANQLLAFFGLTMLARLFGTPYFLWSVSSLPSPSRLAKVIFRFVLSGARGITYRDDHTQDLFASCGVSDEDMKQVADAAFSLRRGSKRAAQALLAEAGWSGEESRPLVALTPRTLRSKDREAETHYSPQSRARYQHEIESYAAVLDWLWENKYQPIFVPMNTMSPDDDRCACKEVISFAINGEHALLIDREFSPRLAARVYQHCQASFVSRVHGSITSVTGTCPPMMYAFDEKHKGIMKVMGLDEFIIDPENHPPEHAVVLMRNLLSADTFWKDELRKTYQRLHADCFVPQKMILELLA